MSNKTIVKYKAGKSEFEIICKPETVLKYRNGKLSRDKVLISDEIYTNSSRGNRAKEADLKKCFDTTDTSQILDKILKEGEYKLTTKENREKIDQQRRAIVHYIHKNFLDPKTNLPHPVTRIEEVLNEIKLRVDPDIPPEHQFLKVKRQINDKITLKQIADINPPQESTPEQSSKDSRKKKGGRR
jgi:ribosome maturation protein SDO1